MTLAAVLHAAASDVGYQEVGNNWTIYWERWKPSWQGQPYCAAGVTDWLSRGGELEEFEGKPIFYCPSIEALAKRRGRWFSSPRVGDIVLYGFGQPEAIHTGIVEKVNSSTIQTIEANTSPNGSGSQNNGGGVYRRVRSRSWGIRGYYRPAYDAPAPASSVPNLGGGKYLTVDGIFDAGTCKALQRFLRLKPTGVWDRASRQAMQRWVGAARDGVVGPDTIRRLNIKVGRPDLGKSWSRDTTRALEEYLNRGIRRADTTNP